MSKLVLILDDSELIVSMLEMVCVQLGHRCVKALRFDEVAPLVATTLPDVILSDLNLPDVSDPVAGLRQLDGLSSTPIIIISGTDQQELERIAQQRGAQGALSKDAGLPGIMTQLPTVFASIF